MTREEAIENLKQIIDEGWLISDFEKCKAIDACEMAIKALEREPILGKIRAEIEEHAKINQNLNADRVRALCWCLDVIDKYKAESEG